MRYVERFLIWLYVATGLTTIACALAALTYTILGPRVLAPTLWLMTGLMVVGLVVQWFVLATLPVEES